jgi:hypothetical protein
VCGLAGYLLAQTLIFPGLGPTAYLFFESPESARSSPRNAVVGHWAATFSVALTGAALMLLDASPAGATVLIVSFGLLDSASQVASLAAGVLLVTVAE